MAQYRGGRKPGVPNKKTQEVIAQIAASGKTPMEFMLEVMRDEDREIDVRLDAAKSVAPYVHPKLAQIEVKHEVEEETQQRLITNKDLDVARTIAFLLRQGAQALDEKANAITITPEAAK